jgi:DNA-binding CsgD family transcriptional regulator
MRGTVYVLETLALIADDAAYTARLLGAVDNLLAGAGQVRPPDWEGEYEAAVTRVRAELGDDGFREAYAAGGGLSVDEAVEYARRGRGPRRRPRVGWESLTPTELEVAGLVSKGLSNPQIAERMFISRKTVATHLSHVFAKLGISSRAALSAEATRHGLGGET